MPFVYIRCIHAQTGSGEYKRRYNSSDRVSHLQKNPDHLSKKIVRNKGTQGTVPLLRVTFQNAPFQDSFPRAWQVIKCISHIVGC